VPLFRLSKSALEGEKSSPHRRGASAFEAAIGSQDAMRRNEERERSAPHRARDAAVCVRSAEGACDVRIRDQYARFKLRDCVPGRDLERRTINGERHIEATESPREICPELKHRFMQERVTDLLRRRPRGDARPTACNNAARIARDIQSASEWAPHDSRYHIRPVRVSDWSSQHHGARRRRMLKRATPRLSSRSRGHR